MVVTTTEGSDSARELGEWTTPWMKLARAGAIAMVVFALGVILLAGEIIPPIAVIGLIYLGFIPFLKGQRRKLGLLYALLSLLILGGNVPFIVSDLARPESSPGFVLTLLSIVAVSLAIGGGLGVFFRWSAEPIRKLASGAAAVFVLGSLISVVIAVGTDSATALPSDTVVNARQVVWSPVEISAQVGTGLWIDNHDPVHHTFTVPELGIDVEIPALKAVRVDLEAAPGVYQVICDVPGHENMTGLLVVSP